MCLLKNELQDTNCGHEDCRNFYAYNKQMCLLGLSQNQTNNLLLNSNSLLQAQAQPQALNTQLFSQSLHSLIHPQKTLNVKRPQSPHGRANGDEEEIILNKKVKAEPSNFASTQFNLTNNDGFRERSLNQNLPDEVPNNLSELSRISQLLNGNNNVNPLLSTLLNPNALNGGVAGENGLFPYNNNIRVPLANNTQNNLLGLNDAQAQSLLQAQLDANNPLSQLLLQAKKGNQNLNSVNPIEKKAKNDTGFSAETFLQEFQTRIFGLFVTQNKMLEDLAEKNDMLQDTLALLIKEVSLLKGAVKQTTKESVPIITADNPLALHQHIGNSTETITVEKLLVFLYGTNPDFQYQLVLKHDLQLPLYRERNFKFTVMLTDKKGNLIENSNRIPLTIGIYSSENPPKFIDSNTAGNKILKGFIDKDLVNGSATFDKVQIKEVTSHFRNGWIFLVVYPKLTGNTASHIISNGSLVVNGQKVKPLVLEKVVVKAKKAKEKDTGNDNEEKNTGEADPDTPKSQ